MKFMFFKKMNKRILLFRIQTKGYIYQDGWKFSLSLTNRLFYIRKYPYGNYILNIFFSDCI